MKYLLLTLLLLFSLASLCADVLEVRQDGSAPYMLIQDALDAAADGDTILVWPGRYYEHLNPGETDNLTLASLEMTTGDVSYRDSTIIDGNNEYACLYIEEWHLTFTLRGFTLTHGAGGSPAYPEYYYKCGGAIVTTRDCDVTIRNCRIKDNRAYRAGGIMLGSESILHLSGTSIHDNKAVIEGGGIYAARNHEIQFDPINRCSIYHNMAGNGNDVYLEYSETDDCIVVDTFTVAQPTRFFVNIEIHGYTPTFSIQNAWMEETNHDLYVAPWGNDDNSGLSEVDPLRTIAVAVYLIASDSLSPNTVHLAAATHPLTAESAISISCKDWITIQGAGINETTLDGLGMTYPFYAGHYIDHVTLRDFSYRNGMMFMMNMENSYTRLENITVEDCHSESSMKLLISRQGDYLAMNNCVFRNCSSVETSGLYIDHSRDLVLKNIAIEEITCVEAQASWNNPLNVHIMGNCTIENLRAINNTTLDATTYHEPMFNIDFTDTAYVDTVRLTNCLFASNIRDLGNTHGSINVGQGVGYVSNCTFADNTGGNGTLRIAGDVHLDNNIFWNTRLSYEVLLRGFNGQPAIGRFFHNDIRGGIDMIAGQSAYASLFWGTGNVDVDPGFSYSPGHEYTLAADSPLIDAGRPDISGLPLPPYDLGYNERVWDGDGDGTAVIDMGCYEYQAMPPASQLEATVDGTDVSLSWQPPARWLRSLTGYRVYRDSLTIAEVESAGQTWHTLINAQAGEHSYYVTAVYGVLDSAPTNEVTVYVEPSLYAPPQGLSAVQDGRDVNLAWSPPSQRKRTRLLSGYMVYRDSLAVQLLDVSANAYTDEDVPPGEHTYWVTAFYDPRESAPSNSATLDVVSNNENASDMPEFAVSCHPNPFNPVTTIRYSLVQPGDVELVVFNMRGQRVATLVNDTLPAGQHDVLWRGCDYNDRPVASGVYFVRLQAAGRQQVRKVQLLK